MERKRTKTKTEVLRQKDKDNLERYVKIQEQ